MQLHTLVPRTKRRINAPVGRGGTRGKTSGRGGKGQTARAGHKIRPETRDLIKKIPKRRGYGRNRSRTIRTNRVAVSVVNVGALEKVFAAGDTVSPATLLAKGLVHRVGGRVPGVKLLASGEVTKAFVVRDCILSEGARAKLTKAGATFNA